MTQQEAGPAPAEERARGWLDHLMTGGRTPWAAWPPSFDDDAGGDGGERSAREHHRERRFLPGAQQLELLRRVNEQGRPDTRLVDQVLDASALGRGLPDLPLVGGPRSRFGPGPVDPGELPAGELLRVAVLMVADLIADVPPAPPVNPSPWRYLRRGYRLVGDPWAADGLRAGLRGLGRPPGGPRTRVYVVVRPLEQLLADTWTHRCFTHGAPPWRVWLDQQAGGALPPGADVARAAATWTEAVGAKRVVLAAPSEVPGLVGVRRLTVPDDLGADAVELARRVAGALEVVVAPHLRPALLREVLAPLLREVQAELRAELPTELPAGDFVREPADADVPRLTVPEQHDQWLTRRAERQRRRVLEAGYAVAGEPDDLLVARGNRPEGPREVAADPHPVRVLRLATRVLLARTRGGHRS